MKTEGMEQVIFSKAFYKVIDFEKVFEIFSKLYKDKVFSMDEWDKEKKTLTGSFVRPYPKGHWNPLSQRPGAMQVMGHVFLENGTLRIETMSKERLSAARKIIEPCLDDSLVFEYTEFKDPLRG